MSSFRSLLFLVVILTFASVVQATSTRVVFQAPDPSSYIAGTNGIIFNILVPNTGGPGFHNAPGFEGATFTLFDPSGNLLATSPPDNLADNGFFAEFAPASFIQHITISGTAAVENIGALFPASSIGSVVIQSSSPLVGSPFVFFEAETLINGGLSGDSQGGTVLSVTTTPEPSSVLLFATGLLGILALLRKGS